MNSYHSVRVNKNVYEVAVEVENFLSKSSDAKAHRRSYISGPVSKSFRISKGTPSKIDFFTLGPHRIPRAQKAQNVCFQVC